MDRNWLILLRAFFVWSYTNTQSTHKKLIRWSTLRYGDFFSKYHKVSDISIRSVYFIGIRICFVYFSMFFSFFFCCLSQTTCRILNEDKYLANISFWKQVCAWFFIYFSFVPYFVCLRLRLSAGREKKSVNEWQSHIWPTTWRRR